MVFGWLRRNKTNMSPEYQQTLANSLVFGESQKTESEIKMMEDASTNYLMINDDRIVGLLEELAKVINQSSVEDTTFHALRVMCSGLIRASWLPKDAVEIYKLQVDAQIIRMKMRLTEDDYRRGVGQLLDSLKMLVHVNYDSAIDGKMAQLLKISGRRLEVGVREKVKKGQQGAMF